MNKKIAILMMAGVVLTGCQSLTDQMGSKLAEGIINSSTNGEVKVNIEDLKNGKINVQTKDGTINMTGNGANGGTISMTDATGKTIVNASGDGKTVVVKDASGKSVMTADDKSVTMTDENGKTATMKSDSGDTRPSDAPADMPTTDNGTDFGYFTYNGMTSLTFKVADKDFKAVCQKEMSAVEGAGWSVDAGGMTMEGSDTILKTYAKGNDNLTLTCGLNDGETTMGLQKTAKSS